MTYTSVHAAHLHVRDQVTVQTAVRTLSLHKSVARRRFNITQQLRTLCPLFDTPTNPVCPKPAARAQFAFACAACAAGRTNCASVLRVRRPRAAGAGAARDWAACIGLDDRVWIELQSSVSKQHRKAQHTAGPTLETFSRLPIAYASHGRSATLFSASSRTQKSAPFENIASSAICLALSSVLAPSKSARARC